jgi:hypothetical protein
MWFAGDPAPEFVGMSTVDAVAKCEARGLDGPRVAEHGINSVPRTADRRPNRLNLWVEDGWVVRAAFF